MELFRAQQRLYEFTRQLLSSQANTGYLPWVHFPKEPSFGAVGHGVPAMTALASDAATAIGPRSLISISNIFCKYV